MSDHYVRMVPSHDLVLSVVRGASRPLTVAEVTAEAEIPSSQIGTVRNRLYDLWAQGLIAGSETSPVSFR